MMWFRRQNPIGGCRIRKEEEEEEEEEEEMDEL